MIDTKEIRKALAIHGVDVLNVDEVLDVLDHLEAAYKEIESWKGLVRQFGNEADELRTHLSFAKDELNRLRAKIAEMEKQEPFDADSDVFRSAFEAALKAGYWPAPTGAACDGCVNRGEK